VTIKTKAPERRAGEPVTAVVPDLDPDEEPFAAAEDLDALLAHLIQKHRELNWLSEWRVKVLWKAEGGMSRGKVTLGRCTMATSLLKHFADCRWIIWLAADHCLELEMTDHQVEALLYHELLHCRLSGRDGDRPGIRGHDAELFFGEVNRYGLWEEGLESLAKVMRRAEEVAS